MRLFKRGAVAIDPIAQPPIIAPAIAIAKKEITKWTGYSLFNFASRARRKALKRCIFLTAAS
jgi:hypothetical protein